MRRPLYALLALATIAGSSGCCHFKAATCGTDHRCQYEGPHIRYGYGCGIQGPMCGAPACFKTANGSGFYGWLRSFTRSTDDCCQ